MPPVQARPQHPSSSRRGRKARRSCISGSGPLLPSPADTIKAYTPLFAHLAKELGVDFDLVATTDWAGMAVAMGSGQLDVAWMGPWGYIIANNATGCQAVATVKYDEKPTYHGHHHRPAGPERREISRRHQGHVDLVRRCRLDLGLADSDLLRQGSLEDRSEDLSGNTPRARPTRPTRSRSAPARSTWRPTSTATATR